MKLVLSIPSDLVNNTAVQHASALLRENFRETHQVRYQYVNNIRAWCDYLRPGSSKELVVALK